MQCLKLSKNYKYNYNVRSTVSYTLAWSGTPTRDTATLAVQALPSLPPKFVTIVNIFFLLFLSLSRVFIGLYQCTQGQANL